MCIFPTISHLYFRLFIWFNFLSYGFCYYKILKYFVIINKIYNVNADTNQKITPTTYWKKIHQLSSMHSLDVAYHFFSKICWNNNVKMVFVKFEEIISGFNQLQKTALIFACYLAKFVEYCWLYSCSLYLFIFICFRTNIKPNMF